MNIIHFFEMFGKKICTAAIIFLMVIEGRFSTVIRKVIPLGRIVHHNNNFFQYGMANHPFDGNYNHTQNGTHEAYYFHTAEIEKTGEFFICISTYMLLYALEFLT